MGFAHDLDMLLSLKVFFYTLEKVVVSVGYVNKYPYATLISHEFPFFL